MVTKDDGCKQLILISYIRCIVLNQTISMDVCINSNKIKKCKNCKQAKELTLLFWKLNPPIRKPIVRTVVKPKQRRPIIKERDEKD